MEPLAAPKPFSQVPGLLPRQKADLLREMLRQQYTTGWRDHHREIADVVNPRRPRFLVTDRINAGSKKNDAIINNVATEASATLRAGLMSGTASPARPWFRYTTHDPNLNEDPEVKAWLSEAERITYGVIAKSNFYPRIEELYGDLGDFGTSVLLIDEDPREVIRCYVFPVGSYFIANSARGQVDTVFRDTSMTTEQLVDKFGVEQCCLQVRLAYGRGDLHQWWDVVHFIMPNKDFAEGALGAHGKKWFSAWFEVSRTTDEGFLFVSGYDYFPCMVPRWSITGADVYGSSPGMTALGDARALQHLEEQALGIVDKTVNPPMNVPADMMGQQASLLPGAENPTSGSGSKMEPAITIHPNALQHVEAKIREHEQRIRTAYHADLFRLLEQFKTGEMTAYEVQQRIQEKMQLIGPAYERTEEELLDPAIEAILHILFENYLLPPIPEQMQGAEIKVEYTSIIAQAQKAAGTGALRELAQVVGNLAAVDHDVLDNIDFDQVVNEYANMLGVPPKILRTKEAVDAIRAEKAKVLAQQQAQQQAQAMVDGAKTLSETDTENKNALTDMLAPTGRV